MKPKPTNKKFSLKKETITQLNSTDMNKVKGGITTSCFISCIAALCKEEQ